MSQIKHLATKAEADTIAAIANRYWRLCTRYGRTPIASVLAVAMDIEGAHCNGCPLQLVELLTAPDATFMHDVVGIIESIDRRTGKLAGIFSPRFAVQQ